MLFWNPPQPRCCLGGHSLFFQSFVFFASISEGCCNWTGVSALIPGGRRREKRADLLPVPPRSPMGTTLSQAWWELKEIASEDCRGAAGKRAPFVLHYKLSLGNVIHAQGLWSGEEADDTLINGLVPTDQCQLWWCPVIA